MLNFGGSSVDEPRSKSGCRTDRCDCSASQPLAPAVAGDEESDGEHTREHRGRRAAGVGGVVRRRGRRALVDHGGARRGRLHGAARPVHRQRGAADDRRLLPRGVAERAVLGAERLRDHLRGAAGAGRAAGRPLRPPPVPAHRGARLHPRLGRVRGRADARRAGGGAGGAGGRRGAGRADLARPALPGVPQAAARDGGRDLGRGRRRRRHRRAAGRRAAGRHRLALDLPHQRADRGGHADRGRADPARGPRGRPGAGCRTGSRRCCCWRR